MKINHKNAFKMGTIPTEWKDSDEGGKKSIVAVLLAVVVSAAEGKADGVWGRVRKGVKENEVVEGLLD